jgi:hypothetical protein
MHDDRPARGRKVCVSDHCPKCFDYRDRGDRWMMVAIHLLILGIVLTVYALLALGLSPTQAL